MPSITIFSFVFVPSKLAWDLTMDDIVKTEAKFLLNLVIQKQKYWTYVLTESQNFSIKMAMFSFVKIQLR